MNFIIHIRSAKNERAYDKFLSEIGYMETESKYTGLTHDEVSALFTGVSFDKKKLIRTRARIYKDNKDEIDAMSSSEFVNYLYNNQDIITDIVMDKSTGEFISGNFKNLNKLI